MYEERKEKFSFKSFFLTLLLVLLFVFLMLWIFPTKWDLDKKYGNFDLERLSVLYDEVFANNVGRMKEAAIGYFTDERMPQVVGESKKLTLRKMYDLHLVLKMKDKNGKECNADRSYVEMTKYTEEYRLKVNLSCGDVEDYIIVYLGCYSYCKGGVCEKQITTPSETTKREEEKYDPTPTPTPNPDKYSCQVVSGKYYDKNGIVVSKEEYDKSCGEDNPPINKKYLYEYKFIKEDCTTCNAWSKWQKDKVTSDENTKVETKTEKEVVKYNEVKIQTSTKIETIKKEVTEKYISGYSTKLVKVGTKDVKVGTTTEKYTENVVVGQVEEETDEIGTGTLSQIPANTSTVKYKIISTDTIKTCSYCEDETMYTWRKYLIKDVYDAVEKTREKDVYQTIDVYQEQEVPVYGYRTVEKVDEIKTPIYETIKIPVYEKVTYYRYKKCKTEKGFTDIKWSNTKVDTALIGKGYKFTGNVKEV